MRRMIRLLLGRGGMTALCLAVQVLALWAFARLWSTGTARLVMALASWIAVTAIVSGKSEAGYKTAWCILVLALPVFGVACYALLGGCRKNRRLRQLHARSEAYLAANLPQNNEAAASLCREAPEAAAQSEALRRLCGSPLWFGGETMWYGDGETCFRAMLEELRGARRCIWLEYFIIRPGVMWDTILTILRRKAADGVDVRLIYDDFGCLPGFPRSYPRALEGMGIACRVCNPFTPVLSARLGTRDHRKLLIVDGNVCYTGGINLADEYIGLRSRFGEWKDGAVRVRGSAVYGFSALFLSMWAALGGEAASPPEPEAVPGPYGYSQPFWDSPLYPESVGRSAVVGMIARARERVLLMTPYFVPDEALNAALCLAAESGVQVLLMTPGRGDKFYTQALSRAHYPRLLEAGVQVYEFTPGFLHEKVCCADGQVAVVGTVNLDYRSFYLQFEDGLWLCGRSAVGPIEEDFYSALSRCRRITPEQCAGVPWPIRISRAVIRLFAPLI